MIIMMALGLGIWPKKLLRVQIPGLWPPHQPLKINIDRYINVQVYDPY